VPAKSWRLLSLLLPALAAAPAVADDLARFEARGQFEDVRDNLVAAIEGHGLVVNATSHISDMLDRTGRDLGTTRKVYQHAEVLEFCSASLSRKAMEANPEQIAFCPYTIAVYTLPEVKNKVFVVYRHPPVERPGLEDVDRLLDSIAREAVK
jgi:uncharacterized protein (DUF302 family)